MQLDEFGVEEAILDELGERLRVFIEQALVLKHALRLYLVLQELFTSLSVLDQHVFHGRSAAEAAELCLRKVTRRVLALAVQGPGALLLTLRELYVLIPIRRRCGAAPAHLAHSRVLLDRTHCLLQSCAWRRRKLLTKLLKYANIVASTPQIQYFLQ